MRKKWKWFGIAIMATMFFAAAVTTGAATELTMYYPVAVGGPLTKIVDGFVADFMKENPDITVKAIYAGNYNDARIKALAALKSGQPAQLSVMFSIDIYELIEQDAIVAFDDVVETAEEKAWLDSFYPTLMENGRTAGKTWGIPFQRSTIVMYYNKDAFRAAGLDPDKPPATWDEMAAMGKKLTKSDGSQWGVMIPSTGYPYWMFGALTMQNDQVLMNGDGNTTYFDDPAVIGALQFWKDLGSKHGVMPKGTIEWGTLRQNFLEGKTAIMWHSTGNLTAVKKERRVRLRRRHAAGQQASRDTHRRRQLLYFQKDDAGRTQGCHAADQIHDQPAAFRRVVHANRLHGRQPGGLRNRCPEAICQGIPLCGGGPGSAQIRHGGAFHLSDRPGAQAAGRCHPGGIDRIEDARSGPEGGPETGRPLAETISLISIGATADIQ